MAKNALPLNPKVCSYNQGNLSHSKISLLRPQSRIDSPPTPLFATRNLSKVTSSDNQAITNLGRNETGNYGKENVSPAQIQNAIVRDQIVGGSQHSSSQVSRDRGLPNDSPPETSGWQQSFAADASLSQQSLAANDTPCTTRVKKNSRKSGSSGNSTPKKRRMGVDCWEFRMLSTMEANPKYAPLFDLTNPRYHIGRNDLWKDLSEFLNVPNTDYNACNKRFTKLKATYKKIRSKFMKDSKVASGGERIDVAKPDFIFWEAMQFLNWSLDNTVNKETKSSFDPENSDEEESEELDDSHYSAAEEPKPKLVKSQGSYSFDINEKIERFIDRCESHIVATVKPSNSGPAENSAPSGGTVFDQTIHPSLHGVLSLINDVVIKADTVKRMIFIKDLLEVAIKASSEVN